MCLRALICLTFAAAAHAADTPISILWSRTPSLFSGAVAHVRLTDGSRLAGRWLDVTPDSFTIDVEKTCDKRLHAKGVQRILRSNIGALARGRRRIRGRVLGTLTGFYAVLGPAGAIARSPEISQGPVGIAAIGAAVAGYFIGRSYDKHLIEVVIAGD